MLQLKVILYITNDCKRQIILKQTGRLIRLNTTDGAQLLNTKGEIVSELD